MGAWYLGFLIIGTLVCLVSTLYLVSNLKPQSSVLQQHFLFCLKLFPPKVPARAVKLTEAQKNARSKRVEQAKFTQLKLKEAAESSAAPAKETLLAKLAGNSITT